MAKIGSNKQRIRIEKRYVDVQQQTNMQHYPEGHLNESLFYHIGTEVYNLKKIKRNHFSLFRLTLNIIQSPSPMLQISPFSSITCE